MFSCYLLRSDDNNHDTCYIGFTTNTTRRLKQHNGDMKHGGAKATKRGRPWHYAAIIRGFPNASTALSFEYMWTFPHKASTFVNATTPKYRLKLLKLPPIQRHIVVLFTLVNNVSTFDTTLLSATFHITTQQPLASALEYLGKQQIRLKYVIRDIV